MTTAIAQSGLGPEDVTAVERGTAARKMMLRRTRNAALQKTPFNFAPAQFISWSSIGEEARNSRGNFPAWQKGELSCLHIT